MISQIPLEERRAPENDMPQILNLGDAVIRTDGATSVFLDPNHDAQVVSANPLQFLHLRSQRPLGISEDIGILMGTTIGSVSLLGNEVSVITQAGLVHIGAITFNNRGEIAFTFNTNASAELVSALLHAIYYSNTSPSPSVEGVPILIELDEQ